jgi:hypothetical protein
VRDSSAGEFDALLAKEKAPDTVPLLVGLNATLNDIVCPAAIVSGKEVPVRTNCALLLLAEDMVTLAPEAPMLTGKVCVVPSATLPKLSSAGVKVNWPMVAPVPVRGMDSAGPSTKRLPPIVAVDCGVNETSNVMLCPGSRVTGSVPVLIEKALPVVRIFEIVTFQVRSFVSTTGFVEAFPRLT